MRLKSSALFIVLFLLMGWSFSYANQIAVAIPYQVRLNSASAVANIVNSLSQDKIVFQNVAKTVAEVEANLNRLKGARYVIRPVLASRGNLYVLGLSLVGSALFDYLTNYLENQKNLYLSSLPPASCQTFQLSCGSYHTEKVCGSQCQSVDVAVVTGWQDDGTGSCFFHWQEEEKYLSPSECIDVDVPDGQTFECTSFKHYFLPGHDPLDYVDCSTGQPRPKNDYPPFVLPPVDDNTIKNLVPAGDYTNSIDFPSSSNIKTPQDISPPLVSSDGSIVYDIPNYSPDGIFSPDYTNPSNYVPDIPINDPSVKINYTIDDPMTGKSYNYTDMMQSPANSSNPVNPTDYTYTPTDKDLDTSINVPEKKDLKTLIMSFIDSVKNRFSFDSSCSGGNCSFSIDVFGRSAVIDFCQFQDIFSMIGSIIFVFSYFYAFFIITKGG